MLIPVRRNGGLGSDLSALRAVELDARPGPHREQRRFGGIAAKVGRPQALPLRVLRVAATAPYSPPGGQRPFDDVFEGHDVLHAPVPCRLGHRILLCGCCVPSGVRLRNATPSSGTRAGGARRRHEERRSTNAPLLPANCSSSTARRRRFLSRRTINSEKAKAAMLGPPRPGLAMGACLSDRRPCRQGVHR